MKKLSTATEGRGRDTADYGGGMGVSGRKEKGLLRCEGKLARAVKWFALEVTRWAPKYLRSPKFKMGAGGPGTGTLVRPVMTWNLGRRGFSFEICLSLTQSDKEIMGRHIEWGFIIGARGLTVRDVGRRWWGYVGKVWWWLGRN
ncbi:hypothetical protein ACJRO7_005710 [Eucalyptus globulus]|uniref:Uncharacterized protein n=1 Tax=Eucalyptus globulus TaxID=34317 RepID=A0ABD3J8J0_EUCGL